MADAYDFWAERVMAEEAASIDRFWEAFAASADELERTFNQADNPAGETDVAAVMHAALGSLWDSLFWEFGPGTDGGHHLALSPELNHGMRPLARAAINRAPDLPGWSFSDARPPDPLSVHTVALIEGRATTGYTINGITPARGDHRRIDFTGTGSGGNPMVTGLTGLTFSVLFGEAVERNWLGELFAERRGLLSSLKKAPDSQDWMRKFVEQTQSVLAELIETRSTEPLGAHFREDAEISLFQVEPRDDPDNPRADMFTYSTPLPDLAQARFARARLSVIRFSGHAESLCGLRIPRTENHPFDQVDHRAGLAAAIHASLAIDGIGGVTGEGHGKAHVYIDFAVSDIAAAMARAEAELGKAGITAPCTLLFDEAGLEERFLTLTPAGRAH